jgi:phosphoribosylglycinamide formyltransferase-1
MPNRLPLKLAILGSTRGTDMEAIISAIASEKLNASIKLVLSDKKDAFILKRAQNYGLETKYLDSSGKTKEVYDKEIMGLLDKKNIDLVLLIGYMRILSKQFVQKWRNKILNVHPSLLPAFGGKMDRDVHKAVIESGSKETGCTVHFVTERVDSGPIVVQKKCSVDLNDTPESLKAKVQKLEGKALVKAIQIFASQNSTNHL